jgi:hypothetical protein
MTMNVLYLQKLYSKNPNALKGRTLFEALRKDAREMRLAYSIVDDAIRDPGEYGSDFITPAELGALEPDLVFIEGGLVTSRGHLRVPLERLADLASRGAVVLLVDVDWNAISEYPEDYREVAKLFGASIGFEQGEPAEIFDPSRYFQGERQIVCDPSDMAYVEWLAPIYQSLTAILAVTPVPLAAWHDLVATCNRGTTRGFFFVGGHSFDEPTSSAFASAKRLGEGFLVLITATVSSDSVVESFPDNVTWLKRLGEHLVDRVRIDRRRN